MSNVYLNEKYMMLKNSYFHLSFKWVTVAMTKITGHRSHNKYYNEITLNIQELPKCVTETWSKQMVLEKWHQQLAEHRFAINL